ncbi:MAG TPA: DUF4166 domain-containing protein, partial [Reyranella sp.]|nr:DUF4166 domain-containing protein [Reyranella sp.]
SLAPLASPLGALADRLRRWGTDRGGLRIDLDGGGGRRRSWGLLAEGGDGPFVPATPAAALVRKLAAGQVAERGATPCMGLLSLAEIEAEWRRAHLQIGAGWLDGGTAFRPSLYRRAIGVRYRQMPAAWQALHDSGASIWQGQCVCDPAETPAGRFLSWLFQFPKADVEAAIGVEFTLHEGGEIWTRRIGGRVMRSRQYIGVRKPRGAVVEQFGPLAFDLALQVSAGRMDLVMSGARLFGVPLPRGAWPRVKAFESGDEGRFRFDVEIGLPLIGRLVRYRGWLTDR